VLISKKKLSRRALLRGLGTAVALPALDAMVPALARGAAGAPLRLAFVYVPNGIIMKRWTPAEEGAGFTLTPALEPLAAVRERLLVCSGLAQCNGRALGDGPGDHARAAASFLTGFHPRKTEGADIHNGVSVDQVAAREVGGATRLASLELGLEGGGLVGSCDSGYSCAYSNSISWRGPHTPMPPELYPRGAFERLFGDGELQDRATRLKLARQNRSLLDFVMEDAASLRRELGAPDRAKLDEYLTAVRDVEQRVAAAARLDRERPAGSAPEVVMERPEGVPEAYEDYARLMFDILTVAFRTDTTRIATFMMAREGSNRTYRAIDVAEGHHGLSHHKGDEAKIEKLARINRHHVELFGAFLTRLAAVPDGDGSLLDHTAIVYGSGLSDGNRHLHHDLPVLVAGGANGAFRMGRHVSYAAETPLNNLFVALLHEMGVKPESLGDSTGSLPYLTGLSA
jgi:hypothetical protein